VTTDKRAPSAADIERAEAWGRAFPGLNPATLAAEFAEVRAEGEATGYERARAELRAITAKAAVHRKKAVTDGASRIVFEFGAYRHLERVLDALLTTSAAAKPTREAKCTHESRHDHDCLLQPDGRWHKCIACGEYVRPVHSKFAPGCVCPEWALREDAQNLACPVHGQPAPEAKAVCRACGGNGREPAFATLMCRTCLGSGR
jgi:hypothetical protein